MASFYPCASGFSRDYSGRREYFDDYECKECSGDSPSSKYECKEQAGSSPSTSGDDRESSYDFSSPSSTGTLRSLYDSSRGMNSSIDSLTPSSGDDSSPSSPSDELPSRSLDDMRVDNNESSPARFSNDVSEDNNDQQEDGGGYVTPPSSPVLTPKAPKVTPEKMKENCMRASSNPRTPLFNRKLKSNEKCYPLQGRSQSLRWVNRHEPDLQGALLEVVAKVRYIQHTDFVYGLRDSIKSAIHHLAEVYENNFSQDDIGQHCITLCQEGKSNLWVAELALKHFRFNAERYMDLGANNADQFSAMLDRLSRSDLNIAKEKFQGRTIVLFDDASYSGKQMSSHILHVRRTVAKYKLDVAGVLAVVPFATSYAQERIQEACEQVIKDAPKACVSAIDTLPSLSDLEPDDYNVVVDLWYKGVREDADKIGLAYFEHKVPNSQSFPVALVKGSIYSMRGGAQGVSVGSSSPVVEEVASPYKGKVAKRFNFRGGVEKRLALDEVRA